MSNAPSDAAAKRRAKQTVINLALSLGASLGIVLVIIFIVPRDDSNRIQPVDYKSIAMEAETSSGKEIVAPELPQGWWSNSARWSARPADGVATWYSGFVGPKNQYIGLTQAFGINPTWLALELKSSAETGTVAIGDSTWTIYEALEQSNPKKTKDFIMVLKNDSDAILLYGTGTTQDFESIAKSVQAALGID
jgi:hypothetical protein